MKTVARVFLREALRHRALTALQLLVVACGVAAAVGMALSARAALGSFARAVAFLQGATTHTIQRPAGPFEETLLPALAHYCPYGKCPNCGLYHYATYDSAGELRVSSFREEEHA